MVIEEDPDNPLKRKLVVWSFNPSFTFKNLLEEE
jgi:hypothetical protein